MYKKIAFAVAVISVIIPMLSVPLRAQVAQNIGIIYIRADGSIDPPTTNMTSADNVTYYFTDNNFGEIVVEKSNIVIDGAGYTLQGNGSGCGISLASISNVTIRNTIITYFDPAILLSSSSGNTLSGNNLTGNTLAWDPSKWGYGKAAIDLESSNNNTLSDNNITENGGIMTFVDGITLTSSSHNTLSDNTITGNNGAGIVIASSCTHNIVSDNNVSENDKYGIVLEFDSNDTVSENSISGNGAGIDLEVASNDTLSDNNITKGRITIGGTTGLGIGISIGLCSNDTVLRNNITGYQTGVYIFLNSGDNMVLGNNIIRNGKGIYLDFSQGVRSSNVIYHNNFLDNSEQATLSGSEPNAWDDGYTQGGNYWSDYNGTDSYSGPYQNETGYDWIGDSPYVIDKNNTDSYPLINPFNSETNDITVAYRNLLTDYNSIATDFTTLNSTFQQSLLNYQNLQSNYTSLQNDLNVLNSKYNSLNTSYSNLDAAFNDYKTSTLTEQSYVTTFLYALATTTIVFMAATAYLLLKKPRIKAELQR